MLFTTDKQTLNQFKNNDILPFSFISVTINNKQVPCVITDYYGTPEGMTLEIEPVYNGHMSAPPVIVLSLSETDQVDVTPVTNKANIEFYTQHMLINKRHRVIFNTLSPLFI